MITIKMKKDMFQFENLEFKRELEKYIEEDVTLDASENDYMSSLTFSIIRHHQNLKKITGKKIKIINMSYASKIALEFIGILEDLDVE